MRVERPSSLRCGAIFTATAFLLGACASVPAPHGHGAGANDPLEPLNRGTFALNQAIDTAVMKPIAMAYRDDTAPPVRSGVSHVLANLREPSTFVNDVLQARPCQAMESLTRFTINSTIGLAGIIDVARDRFALADHNNDFGLTLAHWGVAEGPYLVLPVLGPSNFRDTTGFAVEWFADPVDLVFSATSVAYLSFVRMGTEVVDTRADMLSDLDSLEAGALDKYAAYRSAARQSRIHEARVVPCDLDAGKKPR